MLTYAINRLTYLCDTIPALFNAIPEQAFKSKPAPDKWSQQEELGHLIDSAANNHQRFVRMQFEDTPFIRYSQDDWVACSRYHAMDKVHVLKTWEVFNRHLIEIWKHIPEEMLGRLCNTGDAAPHTLQFLVDDYVVHQEHHLQHIQQY